MPAERDPSENAAPEILSPNQIIRDLCNRRRNSDIRADDKELRALLESAFQRLTESRDAISALFPDDAPHKHPETGVSLLDDVRDLIAERTRIAEERDADYQTKLLSLFDQYGVECDNCGVFLIARAGPDFQEDARGLTSAPEGEEESICGYCAGMELSTLRAELESVTAERDRQYEFNAGQVAKYAALEVDHAGSVTALCFVRSRLIGLRHEACNDELHELSEELTGILSFIDAAISATTAEPEATCKESLQVQPPAEKETGR